MLFVVIYCAVKELVRVAHTARHHMLWLVGDDLLTALFSLGVSRYGLVCVVKMLAELWFCKHHSCDVSL